MYCIAQRYNEIFEINKVARDLAKCVDIIFLFLIKIVYFWLLGDCFANKNSHNNWINNHDRQNRRK